MIFNIVSITIIITLGVFGGYLIGYIFEGKRSSFKAGFDRGFDLCKRLDQETIDNLRKQLNHLINGG